MSELVGEDERPTRYGPKTVLWTSASMADFGLQARQQQLELRALNFDGGGYPLVQRVLLNGHWRALK